MTEHTPAVNPPRNRAACIDCHVDTKDAGEYYMVRHPVWRQSRAGGAMLCIGCLEVRLGRPLGYRDFIACPLNFDGTWPRSERLRDRMLGGVSPWAVRHHEEVR